MISSEDKLSLCVLRLRKHTPFFGALALFLKYRLDISITTAHTDGREVCFSPEFIESLSEKQLDAVMVHELLHAALLHIPRCGSRDPHIWNIAADIVVNGMIRQQPGLQLPLSPCIDHQLENYEVEEVYEILLSKGQLPDIGGLGEDLIPSKNEYETNIESSRELESHWKHALQQAATIARSQGQEIFPKGLLRHIEGIVNPQLDWRSLLWRFLVRTPVDFSGFDHRFVGRGIYLEALQGESVSVRIAIDTSGSICSFELECFIAEVREILRLYPYIDAELYYADTNLYGPYDPHDEELMTPVGGGGTSFKPFFEKVEQECGSSSSTALIYLTDGYGAFPDSPPDQSVLWVVIPGGLHEEDFPFGTVTRLL